MKKSAHAMVEGAYNELVKLKPIEKEIKAYADKMENVHGVNATYSKNLGGSSNFIRLNDSWKTKFGGRVHINVGCFNEKYPDDTDVSDTTHLMLGKEIMLQFH